MNSYEDISEAFSQAEEVVLTQIEKVRTATFTNTVISAESELLKKPLSEGLAANPSTPSKYLDHLARTSWESEIMSVVRNPGTYESTLNYILEAKAFRIYGMEVAARSLLSLSTIQELVKRLSEFSTQTPGDSNYSRDVFKALISNVAVKHNYFGAIKTSIESSLIYSDDVFELYSEHPSWDMIKSLGASWEGTLGSLINAVDALDSQRNKDLGSSEEWVLA